MNLSDADVHALLDHLHEVASGLARAEQRPKDFGTGQTLTRAEIHLVSAIAQQPGVGVTALASTAGVTKGAVSQMVTRLEEKGLVERGPKSGRSLPLFTTPLGQRAHRAHERFHSHLVSVLASLYSSPEQLRRDLAALVRLKSAVDTFEASVVGEEP